MRISDWSSDVCSSDLQRAEDVDPEALPRGAIFGIARHRRRDMVVDPVAARLVVIVGAAAAYGEGADMPDFRQAAGPDEVDLLLFGQGLRLVVTGAGTAAAASSKTSAQSLRGPVIRVGSNRRAGGFGQGGT